MQKSKDLERARQQIGEAIEYLKAKKIISDNAIEFEYNNETYRVVMPTLEQEMEVERAKTEKLNELLSKTDENGNPIYKFKNQWKEIYKKRGIDLDAYESKLQALTIDVENLLVKLAQTQDRPRILELEKQIAKLRDEIADITSFLVDKYRYSIENQLMFFSRNYLLSLVLEKKKGKKWVRVFKNFKELSNYKDTGLIKAGLTYLSYLINPEVNIINE